MKSMTLVGELLAGLLLLALVYGGGLVLALLACNVIVGR